MLVAGLVDIVAEFDELSEDVEAGEQLGGGRLAGEEGAEVETSEGNLLRDIDEARGAKERLGSGREDGGVAAGGPLVGRDEGKMSGAVGGSGSGQGGAGLAGIPDSGGAARLVGRGVASRHTRKVRRVCTRLGVEAATLRIKRALLEAGPAA